MVSIYLDEIVGILCLMAVVLQSFHRKQSPVMGMSQSDKVNPFVTP